VGLLCAAACAQARSGAASGGSDARAEVPATCNTLTQRGALIEVETVSGAAPETVGGSLRNGSYVLAELKVHDPRGASVGKTGVFLRQTLEIKDFTITQLESDARGDARTRSTLTLRANEALRAEECVEPKRPNEVVTAPTFRYSATGAGLLIVVYDPATDAGIASALRYEPAALRDE
jgi:hypothetical protein